MGFKLYDEDAELVEKMSDMASLTNLCTNVFRSYHKAQEDFMKSNLPKLSGESVERSEIELALIPMPAALWEAYLAKAQEISQQTGEDVGCEELMLRVLTEKISAQNVALPSGAKLPKVVGH